jgi:hypothetical protein
VACLANAHELPALPGAAEGKEPESEGGAVIESLVVTLSMYRRAFARGAMLTVGGVAAGYLGIVGGFLMSILRAACLGSLLYLVEMIVRTGKVTWEDFGRSFGVYLWDFVAVFFAFWVFSQLSTMVLSQVPQGHVVFISLLLIAFVLFNAVPELIYLGHYNLAALLARSYEFVSSNWIEWFPPNLLLAVGLIVLWAYPTHEPIAWVLQSAVTALFFYFTMVVRGLLFIELDGSTRRSRIFRHKMGR